MQSCIADFENAVFSDLNDVLLSFLECWRICWITRSVRRGNSWLVSNSETVNVKFHWLNAHVTMTSTGTFKALLTGIIFIFDVSSLQNHNPTHFLKTVLIFW